VLIGGLLSGVMYSLVALGFVLIYKASGVFNFAQGSLVFFAALTFVGLTEHGFRSRLASRPHWGDDRRRRSPIERLGAAAAVNQPPDLAVHGDDPDCRSSSRASRSSCGAPTCAGSTSACRTSRSSGISDATGMNISKFDLAAAGIAAVLVTSLAIFFSRTRIGPRAARGRGRSPGRARGRHSAAADLGDRWAVAGFVALVTGMLWGRAQRRAVRADVRRAQGAARCFILGGFESVQGAIVGGLIIGASEKLAEVFLGPYVGGGIEGWFPYVLALVFLLVRPEGLSARRSSGDLTAPEAHSPCSIAKPASSSALRGGLGHPARSGRTASRWRRCSSSRSSRCRCWRRRTLFRDPHPCLILALAALGLNLLTGFAGQLSLGAAAFMAVGAFASYNFVLRVPGIRCWRPSRAAA
jgi:branched-chain amino acid transport system permease protein